VVSCDRSSREREGKLFNRVLSKFLEVQEALRYSGGKQRPILQEGGGRRKDEDQDSYISKGGGKDHLQTHRPGKKKIN